MVKFARYLRYPIILLCISILSVVIIRRNMQGFSVQSRSDQTPEHADAVIPPPSPPFNENETFWDISFAAKVNESNTVNIQYWGNGIDTYYYFLPSACSMDSIQIGTKHGITLRIKDDVEQPVLYLSNGDTLSDVKCNQTYLLGCYDINRYHYETPVIFMKGEELPSMFIDTRSGAINAILEDKNFKESAEMLLIDKNGRIEYEGGLSYIKGRGNSSWNYAKKPFNIKLSKQADLFCMGNAKKWCLLSQPADYSCLRNKICYDLAKSFMMPYSPDSVFVDLWMNGEYYGLYLLTDRIDVSESSVDIINLEEETEKRNLDDLSACKFVTNTKKQMSYYEIPNDPENISGGYLVETDLAYAEDGRSKFTSKIGNTVVRSPEYASELQISYIRDLILDLEKAIGNQRSDAYKEFIDLESWVKMCLVQEVLANNDFMVSSQYFYKDADCGETTSRVFAGPVWDMELTLGINQRTFPSNVLSVTSRKWFKDLYARSEFQNQMIDEYKEKLRPLLIEMLSIGINEYREQIQASAAMNFTRWADDNAHPETSVQRFYSETKELSRYLEKRMTLFDNLWLNGVDYRTVRVVPQKASPSASRDYLVEHEQALGTLPEPDYIGYLFDGWYDASGKPYDPKAPVLKDDTVYARLVETNRLSPEQLEARGYVLQECEDLDIYLRLIDCKEYIIMMSIASPRDCALNNAHKKAMRFLGLKVDLNTVSDRNYIAVIDRNKVLIEKSASDEELSFSGKLPDDTEYALSSGGGKAVLLIHEENILPDRPGLNIAVFDGSDGTFRCIDSISFQLKDRYFASR